MWYELIQPSVNKVGQNFTDKSTMRYVRINSSFVALTRMLLMMMTGFYRGWMSNAFANIYHTRRMPLHILVAITQQLFLLFQHTVISCMNSEKKLGVLNGSNFLVNPNNSKKMSILVVASVMYWLSAELELTKVTTVGRVWAYWRQNCKEYSDLFSGFILWEQCKPLLYTRTPRGAFTLEDRKAIISLLILIPSYYYVLVIHT